MSLFILITIASSFVLLVSLKCCSMRFGYERTRDGGGGRMIPSFGLSMILIARTN